MEEFQSRTNFERRGKRMNWKGHKEAFWNDGNVLYPDWSMGHTNQKVHLK